MLNVYFECLEFLLTTAEPPFESNQDYGRLSFDNEIVGRLVFRGLDAYRVFCVES